MRTEELAQALGLSASQAERALAEAGVDSAFLARALVENDPHGALAPAARHLGVSKRVLVTALAKLVAETIAHDEDRTEAADRFQTLVDALLAQVAPPEETPVRLQVGSPEKRAKAAAAAQAAANRDVRVVMKTGPAQAASAPAATPATFAIVRRASLAVAALGLALAVFGAVGFVAVHVFQVAVWYLVAALFVLVGVLLVVSGARLYRVAK